MEKRLAQIFGSSEKAGKLAGRFIRDLRDEDTIHYNFLFLVQGKA
jgi:hypothetical protein